MHVTDLADPCRCKQATATGQCLNLAEEGSEHCRMHNGVDRGPAKRMRTYLLNKLADSTRLAQLAEDENVKSLREEIALCRMMIEHRWNFAETDIDKLAQYEAINRYMITLERLIKTAHGVEQSMGSLLSRNAVLGFAQQLVQIVMNRLVGIPDYERIVDDIIEEFVHTIKRANNEVSVRPVAALPAP